MYNWKHAYLMGMIIVAVCLVSPVSANITTINQGDTVFIGEEGLNLIPALQAGENQIAWYIPGSIAGVDEPDAIVPVSMGATNYISSAEFGSRLGAWYSYPSATIAFYVDDPSIALKIWDYSINPPAGEDMTGYPIIKGDKLGFRIDSNLYPLFQRAGVMTSDGGVDIKVVDKNGIEYAYLKDNAIPPNAVSITGLQPSASQYFVPFVGSGTCVWDTGHSDYSLGVYTIWAVCNVNKMNDNYNREGKTYTVTYDTGDWTVPTPPTTETTEPTTVQTTPPTTEPPTTEPTEPVTTLTPAPTQTPTPTPPPTTEETPLVLAPVLLLGTILLMRARH
jgi:hypothetical protein